jgi:hypothetical protein
MPMTTKLNCWQFKNCGREKGGLLVDILGECPVSAAMKYDGCNSGVGGGRSCWMVAESACRMSGECSGSTRHCHNCDFYHRVVFEEEDQTSFRFASCPAAVDSPEETMMASS